MNSSMWIKDVFELGLLYWGHNEIQETARYFAICIQVSRQRVEQYRVLRDVPQARTEFESGDDQPERLARLAGLFSGEPVEKALSLAMPPPRSQATSLGSSRFSSMPASTVHRSMRLTSSARSSYGLSAGFLLQSLPSSIFIATSWRVVGVGTTPNDMLKQHESLYATRAKKKGLGDLIAGEGQFNALVVDFVFAAILKRIGWRGQYRHAWPENGLVSPVGAPPVTRVKPSSFVSPVETNGATRGAKPLREPQSVNVLAALENHTAAAKARRTKSQDLSQDLQKLSALRIDDPQFVAIVQQYCIAQFVSARLNAGQLSDPAGLVEWTEYFRAQHRMSEDLVLLSAPIEIADWEEPKGGQFVYSLRDKKVYLADTDELPDSKQVVERARPGASMWPSIGAFIAWYVGV